MGAILQILAMLLALPALYSALPLQPVFGTVPHTLSTTPSGISIPAPTGSQSLAHSTGPTTQTRGLTARIYSSTQPSMAPTAAANATTSAQDQSSWNSGVISTVVFGCIASILGILAIWATIWLGRRQTSSAVRNNTNRSQACQPDYVLEDVQIRVPSSHDANTISTSVPNPTERPQQPWGISPRGTRALKRGTSVLEAPPPAYVPPNVRV